MRRGWWLWRDRGRAARDVRAAAAPVQALVVSTSRRTAVVRTPAGQLLAWRVELGAGRVPAPGTTLRVLGRLAPGGRATATYGADVLWTDVPLRGL